MLASRVQAAEDQASDRPLRACVFPPRVGSSLACAASGLVGTEWPLNS